MFDLQADDGSVRRREFKSPIPGSSDEERKQVKANVLDGAKMVDMHHRLLDHYTTELDRQYPNRTEMANDEDFYDNIQWTEDDVQELAERRQKALVYNVISASVDWVTNTEKRARSDHKVLPRRKEDSVPAQRKSELMKYLSDVNRTPFATSRAFDDAVKVGIGWLEDGISDEGEEEPIYARYESWRNILHDSLATALDLSDGRYIFRSKWLDLDISMAMFPKRQGLLSQSAAISTDYMALDSYGDEAMDQPELELDGSVSHTSERVGGYQRERVRIIEGWIRVPVKTNRLRGGTFAGEIYDPYSDGHRWSLGNERGVDLHSRVLPRMHVGIFTQAGMLWFSESPYKHNQFPFTPIWGKRRGRDGMPYGMIRGLKGMQEDINKRASKALYIMSTNKVVMDENALPEDTDIEEFRKEVARPDALIRKRQGAQLDLNVEKELSQWQLEFMSRSIAMIQQASGVTDELLGRRTNATSGIAIQRRQDQGSMATAHFFDNLRFASQVRGEKQLSMIEQFMSEKKAFRITNMRGKPEFVTVNNGLPENDIVRTKADFVITDADWHATLRQAAVDALLELITKLPPQIGIVLLDLVVENMDIANRDELVKRIRALTGQTDPDADEPSPEEQQRAQANAEMQQLQRASLVAELKKTMAAAAKSQAEAERIMAQIVGTNVEAQNKALTTAADAVSMPAEVAHTADHILAEAGFVSASDRAAAQAAQAPQPEISPPPQQPQPAPPAGAA